MGFREHILVYILVPLLMIAAFSSYYRFIVRGDYVASFDAACDPEKSACFSACSDDTCTEVEYYSKIQKKASDLYAECGPDITDCDAANSCLTRDSSCSITYCSEDTLADGESCDVINEAAE